MTNESIKKILLLQFYNSFDPQKDLDLNYIDNEIFEHTVGFEYTSKEGEEYQVQMTVTGYIEKRQLQHKYYDDIIYENWYIKNVEVCIDGEQICLISIDDINIYWDEREKEKKINDSRTNLDYRMRKSINYAKFLQKPLNLGMLVPCDKEGNPIEKPYAGMFEIEANVKCSGWAYLQNDKEHGDKRYYDKEAYLKALSEYQQAEEKVLFKGFSVSKCGKHLCFKNSKLTLKTFFLTNNTIEELVHMDLTLTKNAIKKYNI